MKVLFLEDVSGVALGGEVKEVKNGFARNYLLPQRLAVLATRDAMQRVDRLKKQAEETRLKTLSDMRTLAKEVDGIQVNVEMRAGASGRLYGSVTNAVVASQLSEMIGRDVDRRTVEITEPIRESGRFTLHLRLHSEVDATITVLVHPMGADPDEFLSSILEREEQAAETEESNEDHVDAQGSTLEADVVSEELDSSGTGNDESVSDDTESQGRDGGDAPDETPRAEVEADTKPAD